MLTEKAIRRIEAAYIEISAYDFFAPRMLALLNQVSEYKRNAAQKAKPLKLEPKTLTGNDWRKVMQAQSERR
jgi:hypothetical protein